MKSLDFIIALRLFEERSEGIGEELCALVSDNDFWNSEPADLLFLKCVDKGVHHYFDDCRSFGPLRLLVDDGVYMFYRWLESLFCWIPMSDNYERCCSGYYICAPFDKLNSNRNWTNDFNPTWLSFHSLERRQGLVINFYHKSLSGQDFR